MNSQDSYSPVQLLIESQKSIVAELAEQRKINMSLNEAIFKLSSEIKLLSSELRRHDQLEDTVESIAKDLGSLKQIVIDTIENKISTRINPIDERIQNLERNMYKAAGIIGFVVFVVSVLGAVSSFIV